MANKLVTCPYDEAHKVKESRLSLHITKCRLNNLDAEKFICSFNASHVYPIQEKNYHLLNCPDKACIDRAVVFKALEKNNPFKGNTSVPSYTASFSTPCTEIWDDGVEFTEPAPGFVPAKPPACAILEPPALSKPSERRRLYQELHQRRPDLDEYTTNKSEPETKVQINRQPKGPSQVQSNTSNEFKHLGLGRGRPTSAAAPSRIAANIFSPIPAPQTVTANNNYSAVLSGMSNLGFGRGYPAMTANDNLAEDDFPALGCGRGVYRSTKNDIRYPGTRN